MSDIRSKKEEKAILSVSEMQEEIVAIKKKLLGLRIKASNGELKNTSEVKKFKKKIAQLLTKVNNQGV